ncbi:hypothetical protein MOB86_14655 [Bacillus haynesii]|uniref:hypothetical protein n=1 Tax=Bacillus haynesii TaxID=1925021 RepID=UPI0022832594|nr:hypothetical protein [Bacillus haynesii]MCY8005441.1 hypothetical protein [Bacillus haynesii]
MSRKSIFCSLILVYILIYTTYNLRVALSMENVSKVIDDFDIPKLIIVGVGLFANVVVFLILVNLSWFFTSIGLTYNRGEKLADHQGIKKLDYYIIYFSIYSLHFAILIFLALFNWGDIINNFASTLKMMNVIVVIITFLTLIVYMYRCKVLTKISFVSILILNIINIGYSILS